MGGTQCDAPGRDYRPDGTVLFSRSQDRSALIEPVPAVAVATGGPINATSASTSPEIPRRLGVRRRLGIEDELPRLDRVEELLDLGV